MAIPFNVPSDQETQEVYRRIGQVLLEVYEIVTRFIQLRQTAESSRQEAQPIPQQQAPPGPPDQSPQDGRPPIAPLRRRRRRSKQMQRLNTLQERESEDAHKWLNVGIELRHIAEEFTSTEIRDGFVKKKRVIKASSLFSLLIPAPLSGSIWTTVIILVGWRILAKNR